VNACTFFSAADAQSILGAPVTYSKTQNPEVCMYVEASPKEGGSMVLEYRASPDALKAVAKRIADQLP
jgi:hypothetical protein